MQFSYSLLIVMRSESLGDFEAIARRVRKIDPSIWIHLCPDRVDPEKIPPGFLNLPLLSIYLVNPPPDTFKPSAGQLAVKSISKLEEYEHFKKHDIPCLPIEAFRWGMELDKSIYGDWVVLKPQTIQSTGKDVNMVPTHLIPTLKLDDFPEDHLIRQDNYYVQKFIKTGETPTHHRVLVFCGEVLYIRKVTSIINFPNSHSEIKKFLSSNIASNVPDEFRETSMPLDEEIFKFALKVANTHKDFPLFGLDVLRNEETDQLICLEQNTGGNVWHFSSNLSRETGVNLPSIARVAESIDDKKAKIHQYAAWDQSAKALIKKVYALAR